MAKHPILRLALGHRSVFVTLARLLIGEIVCERIIGTRSSPVAWFTARKTNNRRELRIKSSEFIRKLSDCKLRIPCDRQC